MTSRGFLTSFPEVFINSGILLGYISNFAFSRLSLHLGWRFMLGIGALPSVLLTAGILAMPNLEMENERLRLEIKEVEVAHDKEEELGV